MKNKTKKGILYLGFVYLLCISSIIPCIILENVKPEIVFQKKFLPKFSNQDISLATPEEFSHIYTEDFTTTNFRDDSFTTTSGWGSGALTLPGKNLTISALDNPSNHRSKKVHMSGDIVYSANSVSFEIYDISNHSELNVLSSYSGYTQDFALSGNYAYIAAGAFGLNILDISNKNNPILVGSCSNYHVTGNPSLDATGVTIKGSYIYLWDGFHGLIVINVANPSNPFRAGYWNELTGGPVAETMLIDGNYLYFLQSTTSIGLIIFDISSPTAPSDVYTYYTGTSYNSAEISGNYIYLTGDYTLDILNIVTPSAPSLISSTSTGVKGTYYGVSIALDNSFAYIGGCKDAGDYYYGIVEMYDISNVASPHFEYIYISAVSNPSHDSGIDSIDVINGFSFMGERWKYYLLVDFTFLGQYEASASAQSLSIYTGTSNVILNHSLLTVSADLPPDTGITYYISSDNGNHWEQIIPNSIHLFEYQGNQLKWKAIFTSSDDFGTPELNSLNISYLPLLNRPNLLSPSNYTYTDDNTPYFEWEDMPEATDYLIQLDTSPDFNTVDYISQNVSNNYWTANLFLPDNTWYWRVAGIDSKNDIGLFSTYNILYIDGPPGQSTLISPENNSHVATSNPTFTWSEAYGTLNYTLQIDSTNTFSSGELLTYDQILSTNYSPTSSIADGIWYWRIQAFDNTGHSGPYSNIHLITLDTILPLIDQPNDITYEQGSTGNQIVWNPNDLNPDHYEVTRDGTIVNSSVWDGGFVIIDIDGLSFGTYIYICTVYDKAGNSNYDSVIIRVEEAESPFDPIIYIYIVLGVIGVSAIPVIYYFLKKSKSR